MIRNLRYWKKTVVFFTLLFMGLCGMAQVPVITGNPVDTTVCISNDISFTVTASNNPTSYRWQYFDATGWHDISSVTAVQSIFSGFSTNTITVHSAPAVPGAELRCIASNADGDSDPSATITIHVVRPHPDFSIQPLTFQGNASNEACAGTMLYILGAGTFQQEYVTASYSGTGATFQNIGNETMDSAFIVTVNFSNNASSGIISITDSDACGVYGPVTAPVTIDPPPSTVGGAIGFGTTCSYEYGGNYVPGGTEYSGTLCSPIAAIAPSGTNPIDFVNIKSCVTVDSTVSSYGGVPYVQRHYNLEPEGVDGSTSTATLILYYTQTDFDNYNTARGSYPALPANPTDSTGISNLRITQFHGTGTDPGTYVSGSGTIDPADSNIVWDAAQNRWEVTFDIVGFSGFFISSSTLVPLPLTLTDFTGQSQADGNLLQWTTSEEENTKSFEVEREVYGTTGTGTTGASTISAGDAGSNNGFQTLGTLPAAGNSHTTLHYSYKDVLTGDQSQTYAYRLKMTDLDGKVTYSKMVVLQPAGNNAFSIQLSPNPYHQALTVSLLSPATAKGLLTITDISGKKIAQENISLTKGLNTFQPESTTSLRQGSYLLTIVAAGQQQTVQLVKY